MIVNASLNFIAIIIIIDFGIRQKDETDCKMKII